MLYFKKLFKNLSSCLICKLLIVNKNLFSFQDNYSCKNNFKFFKKMYDSILFTTSIVFSVFHKFIKRNIIPKIHIIILVLDK